MADRPDIQEELQKRGNSFAIGLDTDRKWVNGVQVFPTPEYTLFVFREQGVMGGGETGFEQVMKNVSSVVMPTSVAVEFRDILNQLLPSEPND
ncbi:hypothetical protein [Qipengyuania qiaonensis]|uniref:Uncharacterized protein n=1 Tax=Qipengyuania qiaonensis TaxID=2867240 RepID=A0ABS7J8S4_9SPHN|nr:hypothetical protein [Qipengyuania qiaonensis]MBX7482716.1 hypothetical protein [Qipengyuania qiaonensis]